MIKALLYNQDRTDYIELAWLKVIHQVYILYPFADMWTPFKGSLENAKQHIRNMLPTYAQHFLDFKEINQ